MRKILVTQHPVLHDFRIQDIRWHSKYQHKKLQTKRTCVRVKTILCLRTLAVTFTTRNSSLKRPRRWASVAIAVSKFAEENFSEYFLITALLRSHSKMFSTI